MDRHLRPWHGGVSVLMRANWSGLVQNLSLVADAEVVTGGNAVILSIRTGAAGTTYVKEVDIEYSVI